MTVNIHEAKTSLSRLIERARMGEEIVIAKAGKPVVKLVRVEGPGKRVLGSAAGQIVFHPGWDAPMDQEQVKEFLGEASARHEHIPVVHRGGKKQAVDPRRRSDRR